MNCKFSLCRFYRVIALLLVLAVPILSTIARNDWYLSASDQAHYLIDASKAELPHGPSLHASLLLRVFAVRVPPQSRMRVERYLEPAPSLPLHSLGVAISPQLRAPPIRLA